MPLVKQIPSSNCVFWVRFLLENIKTKVYSIIICIVCLILTNIVDEVSDACIAVPKYAQIMETARKNQQLASNQQEAAELVSKLELELNAGEYNTELAAKVLYCLLILFDIY